MLPEVYLPNLNDFDPKMDFEAVIVSRHGLLRLSLQRLIEPLFGRVRCYQQLDQLSLASDLSPSGLLLLLDPAGETTLCAQVEQATRQMPGVRVVLLLKSAVEVDMAAAVHAGARGCITQETAPETIASMLSLIADGHIVWPFTQRASGALTRRATDMRPDAARRRRPEDFAARLGTLSKREIEVLERVGEGLGNKRIASTLHISDTTVRLHMRSIMRKLGAENRTQVALFASHPQL